MPLSDNVRPDRAKEESIRKKLDDIQALLDAWLENFTTVHLVADDANIQTGVFDDITANDVTVDDTLTAERILSPLIDVEVLKTGPIISHPQVVRENATYTGQLTRVCRLSDADLTGTAYVSGVTQAGIPMFRLLIDFSEKFAHVVYDQKDSGTGARYIEVVGVKKIANASNPDGYDVELFIGLGGAAQNLKLLCWGFNIETLSVERLPVLPLDYSTQILQLQGVSPDDHLANGDWLGTVIGNQFIHLIRFNPTTNMIELGEYPILAPAGPVYVGEATEGNELLTRDQVQAAIIANQDSKNAGVYSFYAPSDTLTNATTLLTAQLAPSGANTGDLIHAVLFTTADNASYEAEGTVNADTTVTWAAPTAMDPAPVQGEVFVALAMLDRPIGNTFAQGKVYFSNGAWVEMPDVSGSGDDKDITLDNNGALTFKRRAQGTDLVLNDVDASQLAYDSSTTIKAKIEALLAAVSIIVPATTMSFNTLGDLVVWMQTNMNEGTINLGDNVFTVLAASGGSLNIPKNTSVQLIVNGVIANITSDGELRVNGGTYALQTDNNATTTICTGSEITGTSALTHGYVEFNGCSSVTTSKILVTHDCTLVIKGAGTYDSIDVQDGGRVILDTNSTATITSLTGQGMMVKEMDFS